MNKIYLLCLTQCVLSSYAIADCPDDLSVENLAPGTTIEMKLPLKLDSRDLEKNEKNPNFRLYTARMINGNPYPSSYQLPVIQRSVAIAFPEENAKDKKQFEKGEIPPFKCAITPVDAKSEKTPDPRRSKADSDIQLAADCPMNILSFQRAHFDPRRSKMTIGSLKHNLGSRFLIIPKCSESDQIGPGISAAKVKKQSPSETLKQTEPKAPALTHPAK